MNQSQIYRLGYDAAIMGCRTIDDCPYRGNEHQEKRAWVLGYINGMYDLFSHFTI